MRAKHNRMRFTLIDGTETISFASGGHILKALAAACATGSESVREVLARANEFDDGLERQVLTGLAVFDEHVISGDRRSMTAWLDDPAPSQRNVFRVLNQDFRNLSLRADTLGIVLFNLPEKRIIQVENHYGALQRRDRSRYRRNGTPTRMTYQYALPESWSIVP